MPKILPEQIDKLLPQTQCGLCGYKGCMPYATALSHGQAEINLCPPGGVNGLKALATLLEKDPAPFINEMTEKEKFPMIAYIRESECIGCTKCINVCPVDAIMGAPKLMHTIITDECTGCELCIAPCPVDCIDMIIMNKRVDKKDHYRQRYLARNKRIAKSDKKSIPLSMDKKSYIEAALSRVKNKKLG